MVRVRGPLHSTDASGTVAKTLVASKWKGRHYLKMHQVPSDPVTLAQRGHRAALTWLSQEWNLRSTSQRDTWSQLAAPNNIPAYNAFVSYNLNRIIRSAGPTQAFPAAEDGAFGTYAGARPLLDDAVWSCTTKVEFTQLKDAWGSMLFIRNQEVFTPTIQNLWLIYSSYDTDQHDPQITPLAPGTWWLRGRQFTTSGKIDDATAADSGVSLPYT